MAESTGEIVVNVPSKIQKKVDRLAPSGIHYPTDDVVREVPEGVGLRIDIPRWNIFGRQTGDEYSQGKSLRVIRALEHDPEGYLRKDPILVCLVPKSADESALVIVDGHHRFRESGRVQYVSREGVRNVYDRVPSMVFTPDEMADLLNRSGHEANGLPYTGEILTSSLLLEVADAESDFADRMSERKQPVALRGVSSIADLPRVLAPAQSPARSLGEVRQDLTGEIPPASKPQT
ncbi:MAG: hypothetical protein KBD51_02750 [Candidatus Levybacteria bacterium]|nr:hypothetical protein [Candidatus Levybacteria bacterium]